MSATRPVAGGSEGFLSSSVTQAAAEEFGVESLISSPPDVSSAGPAAGDPGSRAALGGGAGARGRAGLAAQPGGRGGAPRSGAAAERLDRTAGSGRTAAADAGRRLPGGTVLL